MAQIPSAMDMDIDFDMFKERSASSSKNCSRESLVLFKVSLVAYYKYMEINNLLSDDTQEPIDSLQLFYTSDKEEVEESKVINKTNNKSS